MIGIEPQEYILNKFEKYNSYISSKGIRRTKAIEWAISELNKSNNEIILDIKQESLLQKVGWNTFVGLSLYISLIEILKKSENKELQKISHTLYLLIQDILELTDIGNTISFGVSIDKTEQIKYARVDNAGNIFIFPIDTEDLLIDIEENL